MCSGWAGWFWSTILPDRGSRTGVYARVWSADQKADLDRQVAGVSAWAMVDQVPVDKVVTEVFRLLTGIAEGFSPCWVTRRSWGSWWSIGIGCAGSVVNTSKRRLPVRAANWSCGIQPGSMKTGARYDGDPYRQVRAALLQLGRGQPDQTGHRWWRC